MNPKPRKLEHYGDKEKDSRRCIDMSCQTHIKEEVSRIKRFKPLPIKLSDLREKEPSLEKAQFSRYRINFVILINILVKTQELR